MKKQINEYIVKCLECKYVKIEHKNPTRLSQQTQIMKWKWEVISMDFIPDYQGTLRNIMHSCGGG